MEPVNYFDPHILKEIVNARMHFGKYKDRYLTDIPVHYLEWMEREGMPKGKLGMQLSTLLIIKSNGLESILTELKKRYRTR